MLKFKLNRSLIITVVTIMVTIGLSSCGSHQSLYSWHKYEDASYQYSKKHTEKTDEKFVKEITKVIENQSGTRKTVPPGIYAEYGFYLYKNGQKEEALEMLKKEMELYPESSVYISRIINQIQKCKR